MSPDVIVPSTSRATRTGPRKSVNGQSSDAVHITRAGSKALYAISQRHVVDRLDRLRRASSIPLT
jgi:hypothetical protein